MEKDGKVMQDHLFVCMQQQQYAVCTYVYQYHMLHAIQTETETVPFRPTVTSPIQFIKGKPQMIISSIQFETNF